MYVTFSYNNCGGLKLMYKSSRAENFIELCIARNGSMLIRDSSQYHVSVLLPFELDEHLPFLIHFDGQSQHMYQTSIQTNM